MYRLINQNCEAVVEEIGRNDDIARYRRLRSALQSRGTDAVAKEEYQSLYRDYWRMNAALLNEPFYAGYFELLAKSYEARDTNVETIARKLWLIETGARRSLQFSFATKLAHMVDPHLPVYDRFVADFYFYVPPSSSRPFDSRLGALMDFYQFLRREYGRVLEHGLLDLAIRRFRTSYPIGADICDGRVVDWLVWAWVSLLRHGAQRQGQLLYD